MVLRKKNILLYFAVLVFSFLFIFQGVFRNFYDECLLIILIPIIALVSGEKFSIPTYSIGVIALFLAILFWSTEPHSNFLYYFIGVEFILFIRPKANDMDIILRIIQKVGFIYAISVILSFIFPGLFQVYANLLFPTEIALDYIDSLSKNYNAGLNYQVSFTALYISIAFIIVLFGSDRHNYNYYLKLGILFLALVLTNKRAHFLYLFITCLFVFYCSGKRGKKTNRFIKILLILFIALLVFKMATLFLPDIPIISRLSIFLDSSLNINVVTSGRIAIYIQMIEIFSKNKLTGVGWQNFADYSNSRSLSGAINQGHNVFLQIMCETGIIGLVFFLSIMIIYFFRSKKLLSTSVGMGYNQKYYMIGLSIFIFYWLFWISGNPLYDPVYYLSWIISLVIIFSAKRELWRS